MCCSSPGPSLLSSRKRPRPAVSSHATSRRSKKASGFTALAISRARTAAGRSRSAGTPSMIKAPTPATAGDAMLVPLKAT